MVDGKMFRREADKASCKSREGVTLLSTSRLCQFQRCPGMKYSVRSFSSSHDLKQEKYRSE